MFGKLKEKLSGGANRLKGNSDLLEGICAAGVMTGSADGNFDDNEGAVLLDRLLNHDTLSAAFTATQIETAFEKQLKRAQQGMTGRLALRREIEEVKKKSTADDCEMLLMIALDVAGADGDIDPKEMTVLKTVAQSVGLSLDRYL